MIDTLSMMRSHDLMRRVVKIGATEITVLCLVELLLGLEYPDPNRWTRYYRENGMLMTEVHHLAEGDEPWNADATPSKA